MKTFRFPHLLATCLAALALALPAQAEDEKEVILTGTGLCAKCTLEKTPGCINAIIAEHNGKEVTFYMKNNAVARDFHTFICHGKHPITAKGTLSKDGDQWFLDATEIAMTDDDDDE